MFKHIATTHALVFSMVFVNLKVSRSCGCKELSYHRMDEKRKHDCTTMAIRNAGVGADIKVITLNKLTAKRKVKCLEIPHYA